MSQLMRRVVAGSLLILTSAAQAAMTPPDSTVPVASIRATSAPSSQTPAREYVLKLGGGSCRHQLRLAERIVTLSNSAGPNNSKCKAGGPAPIARTDRQPLAPRYAMMGGIALGGSASSVSGVGLATNLAQPVPVSAVPLPPAAVLFAGSLVALGAVGRYKRDLTQA